MISALDVAKYFLSLQDEDAGDAITNLKLQKLLYYAQGFYIAETGQPLFDAPVEAWQHGPVVPVVYREFKGYNGSLLPFDLEYDEIPSSTAQFLNDIYNAFGQFSAWRLSEMTHGEEPWRSTQPGQEIPREVLKRYFETRID